MIHTLIDNDLTQVRFGEFNSNGDAFSGSVIYNKDLNTFFKYIKINTSLYFQHSGQNTGQYVQSICIYINGDNGRIIYPGEILYIGKYVSNLQIQIFMFYPFDTIYYVGISIYEVS